MSVVSFDKRIVLTTTGNLCSISNFISSNVFWNIFQCFSGVIQEVSSLIIVNDVKVPFKDDTWFHVDVDGRDVFIITSFLFLNI